MRDGRIDTRPNIAFERTACLTAFPYQAAFFLTALVSRCSNDRPGRRALSPIVEALAPEMTAQCLHGWVAHGILLTFTKVA